MHFSSASSLSSCWQPTWHDAPWLARSAPGKSRLLGVSTLPPAAPNFHVRRDLFAVVVMMVVVVLALWCPGALVLWSWCSGPDAGALVLVQWCWCCGAVLAGWRAGTAGAGGWGLTGWGIIE